MLRTIFALLTCFLGFWPCQAATGQSNNPSFRAGAATSNITPELGMEIVGGFVPYPATHTHDELHAQASARMHDLVNAYESARYDLLAYLEERRTGPLESDP